MKNLEDILKSELIGNHSTAKSKLVAKNIKTKKELQALINLISPVNPYPVPEAASWCIRHALDSIPQHHSFIGECLVKKLGEFERDSLLKNILGVIKHSKFPDSIHGELADYCLRYMTQPNRSKAVLYNSLDLMTTICKTEPGLSRELILIAEELVPIASPAFKRKLDKTRKTLSVINI